MRFYDYDHNIIEIGEPIEYVAYRLYLENTKMEEISKITYLPIEKISEAIKYQGHRTFVWVDGYEGDKQLNS